MGWKLAAFLVLPLRSARILQQPASFFSSVVTELLQRELSDSLPHPPAIPDELETQTRNQFHSELRASKFISVDESLNLVRNKTVSWTWRNLNSDQVICRVRFGRISLCLKKLLPRILQTPRHWTFRGDSYGSPAEILQLSRSLGRHRGDAFLPSAVHMSFVLIPSWAAFCGHWSYVTADQTPDQDNIRLERSSFCYLYLNPKGFCRNM